jgi:subtilisin family serine protease
MKMWGRVASPLLFGIVLGVQGLAGCAENDKKDVPAFAPPGANGEPEGLVVTPPRLPAPDPGGNAANPSVPGGDGPTVTLPGGGQLHSVIIDGKPYVPIELTFSERSWQSIIGKAGFGGLDKAHREASVQKEIEAVFAKIGKTAKVAGVDVVPSVGWASAYVPMDAYESLSGISGIGRRLLVNPIVKTPVEQAERDLRQDRDLGFAASGAFSNLEDLVGNSRMGVDEFIADAAQDLGGYKPNGSHVTIGVVDTGITFNHPAFKDAQGASRIDSMKDFTGEGRIFFTAAGRFTIAPGPAGGVTGAQASESLSLTADFLVSPPRAFQNPDPNALEKIENEPILVPAALKALLEAPNASGARFGVLDEVAYGNKTRSIDLDHNGKMDDRFYAILIPGQDGKPDTVWLSLASKGDFRQSQPLTNFDLSHETVSVWAERIGLDIKKENILDATGAGVPVTTAAIVGFDPGNHGSHVAGISAARKIIANAPDDTKLHGVAPLARIASGRICANTAGCSGTKAIAELSNAGAHVINMSIGSLGPDNDGYGVQEAVVDRLTVQNGTVFVIAASNDGPGRQTVGSPSTARFGISVAATATQKIIQAQYSWPGSGKNPASDPNAEDFLMYFSSRGPTSAGGMKPDIAAPGTWLSAIQLNAAPAGASGLDVMWGTSMASPAMAGAVALLLDAAKVYNDGHREALLAIDGRTIRRVVLASARPFDVTTLDVRTNETKRGQYTWVDQGFGMVNLQRAWALLKDERTARKETAVHFMDNGVAHEVPLDYQVRVLRTNPNGLAYDGSQSIAGAGDQPEAKFGRGLWIDAKATESIYKAQIARRLPADVVGRPDVGDLSMQLQTTADQFEFDTTIHGSHLNWVRPSLNELDCTSTSVNPAVAPRLLVVGEGSIDVPVDPVTGKGGAIATANSAMNICVNRGLVDALPPGDHGAVITAYRVIGNKREAVPSFTVPVYVTVPHKTLAGPEGLHVTSTVGSFGVSRHYIEVPKDTTVVKVTLDLPPALQTGTAVTGCAGVILEALEGGNTLAPPEFTKTPGDAIAQNCSGQGRVAPDDWRRVQITRSAPKPGIWDLHVFGLYAYKQSPFTLDVAFAKVTSSKTQLNGPAEVLQSTFNVDVVDASYALKLSNTLSTFTLNGYGRDQQAQIASGETLRVPNGDGAVGRSYPADVASVTLSTGMSTGNDLDLTVLECDDPLMTVCRAAGKSAGPADTETVTFQPKAGKLYVAEVEGYAITTSGSFNLREDQRLNRADKGTLTIAPADRKFAITTAFDPAQSTILADDRHKSGKYTAEGSVDLKDEGGTLIVRVPVHISAPQP